MLSSLVHFKANRIVRRRWFWLLNGLLLLLYLWSFTGQTRVAVTATNGHCTAAVPGRTLTIECPELQAGSRIGLYLQNPEPVLEDFLTRAPLQWAIPPAAWASASLSDVSGRLRWTDTFMQDIALNWTSLSGVWYTAAGHLWSTDKTAAILHATPATGDFTFTAHLRRPEAEAGLLLLEPAGDRGLAFIISGTARRGVWWRWANGELVAPLVGIPFTKPLLAQFQWLLQVALRAHQGALLLLLTAWLLSQTTHLLRRLTCRLTVLRQMKIRYFQDRQRARRSTTMNENLSPVSEPALSLPKCLRSPVYSFILHPSSLIPLILPLFAITLFIAGDVLERIPHVQDSVTYLFQAQTLARGRLWAPAPPLPDFFEQQFLLVRDGRWFGKYPPGFPAILAAGVWLKLPWLVNPLLAILTIPLLYVLGTELYGRRLGLAAAPLAITSPFLLFMSGSMMAHPAELFWITLFMVSWLRALRRESSKWAAVAGVAVGMAFLTRQLTAIAVGIPFIATTIPWLESSQKGEQPRSKTIGMSRLLPRPLVPLLPCGFQPLLLYYPRVRAWQRRLKLVLVLGLAALPFLILLLGYQWAMTGSPWQDPRLLFWDYDKLGFGPEVGERANLLRVVSTQKGEAIVWYYDPSQPPRGHTFERGLHNTGRNWQELEEYLFGWPPLFGLAFVWLAFLARRPARADWLLLAAASGPVIAHIFYWASGIMYGPRYFYPVLPPLLLLTVRGIQAAAGWLGDKAGRVSVVILLALLISSNLLFYLPNQVDAHRGYNFVSGKQQALVATTIPQSEEALIFVAGEAGHWWDYGALFSGNTPWLDGRIIYARDLGDRQNARLLALYPEHTPYRLVDRSLIPLR